MALKFRTHDRPNSATLDLCLEIADLYFDGHFTLLKFKTNWRAGFITPMSREDIASMAVGASANAAIMQAIIQHPDDLLLMWARKIDLTSKAKNCYNGPRIIHLAPSQMDAQLLAFWKRESRRLKDEIQFLRATIRDMTAPDCDCGQDCGQPEDDWQTKAVDQEEIEECMGEVVEKTEIDSFVRCLLE